MATAKLFVIGSVVVVTACGSGSGTTGTQTASSSGSGQTSSSSGTGGSAGSGGHDAGTGGALIGHPNPIISRDAKAFSSPNGGRAVVDGIYHNGGWSAGVPTADTPSWVAIQLTAGPTRVLVSWDDGGTYNYKDPTTSMVYGLPAAYHIDVSSDSTNGADGTWTMKAMVDSNAVRTRAHAIDFTGMSWVKMVITAAPPNISANGVQIGEIDVHDISATGTAMPDDTWFFMGDSITAFAYQRSQNQLPSFADILNSESPSFYPAMINGGIGGELSSNGLARLDEDLMLNPDYRYWVLGYGTNDAGGGQVPTATYKANMQMMIDKLKAAGRTPILPRVPYSTDPGHAGIPSYNTVVDDLTKTNNLMTGPDFYAYFMAHQDQLMDALHPGDAGQAAMNKLWADAVRSLYP